MSGLSRAGTSQRTNTGSGGAVYGLGFLGALVYYWRSAEDTGDRIRALPKAVCWPAFVVYDLLQHLAD
ncbi:MAG: hypothetical protein ACXWBN_11815 [Acidimicrobiales bacterium]